MKSFVVSSLALVRDVKILLLHFTLNLLLFGACVVWLIIPDKHASQLVLTAVVALLIVFAALWLHAGTLSYAADGEGTVATKFLRGVKHAISFLLIVGVLYLILSALTRAGANMTQMSGYIFSKSPAWVRDRISPEAFDSLGSCMVRIFSWYVVPGVVLPLAASAARFGFSRELPKSTLRAWRDWRYWALLALLVGTGLWIPSMLVNFVRQGSLRFETVSLILRFGIAYLLAVVSWLSIAGMLGHLVAPRVEIGKDAPRQPVA